MMMPDNNDDELMTMTIVNSHIITDY